MAGTYRAVLAVTAAALTPAVTGDTPQVAVTAMQAACRPADARDVQQGRWHQGWSARGLRVRCSANLIVVPGNVKYFRAA